MSEFLREYGMLIVTGLLAMLIVTLGVSLWSNIGQYTQQCADVLGGGILY